MTITRQQKANAIRALSMDAVQQAASGHPGMPMGVADIIGIDSFGASAPADELYANFGITVDRIVEAVEKVVTREGQVFPAAVAN